MTLTREQFDEYKSFFDEKYQNYSNWQRTVRCLQKGKIQPIIVKDGQSRDALIPTESGRVRLVSIPNDPNNVIQIADLFNLDGVNSAYVEEIRKRENKPDLNEVSDRRETVTQESSKYLPELRTDPTLTLSDLQNLLMGGWENASMLSAPVQEKISEMILEQLETKLTGFKSLTDEEVQKRLNEQMEKLNQFMGRVGVDVTLKDLLETGLRIYKKEHPNSPDFPIDSPQGLALAMKPIHELIGTLMAVPQNIDIYSKYLLRYERIKRENGLKGKEIKLQGDLRILSITKRAEIGKALTQSLDTLEDGVAAEQSLSSLQKRWWGIVTARVIEGFAYIIPAIPKGISDSLAEWVSKKPITAACAIGAVIWAGGAWVLCSSLPLTVIPALAIFMAGPLAQGIKDYGKEKTKN